MITPENKPGLIKAYCLITTEAHKAQEVSDKIKGENPQVSESDRVAGTYDIVSTIYADTPKELGEVYLKKIQQTEYVLCATLLVSLDNPSSQTP